MKDQATFRPFRPEDKSSLAHHANNVNIWNNTRDYLPFPYTEKDAEEFIALSAGGPETFNFAIDVHGEAVGAIGYIPLTDVQRISAEVGFWLGEEFWNRGITTRVMLDFAEFIFARTDIIHLYASVFEGNPASMRVLEKSGFSRAGIMHRAAVKNGRIIDLHIFEKLKSI